MTIKKAISFSVLFFTISTSNLMASWQDLNTPDSLKFILNLRGGGTLGKAKFQNDLGNIYIPYSTSQEDTINIGTLEIQENFFEKSLVGNIALGFSFPYFPQIRVVADWLHISSTSYEISPLFNGPTNTTDGEQIAIGMSDADFSTDTFSAFVYLDVFSGNLRQKNSFIPYLGVGIGVASSDTFLTLIDKDGFLFSSEELAPFYEKNEFYPSQNTSTNITGSVELGFAYRITQHAYIDFGTRLTYIPGISWALNNRLSELATTEEKKDVYNTRNMLYTSVLLGIRLEF